MPLIDEIKDKLRSLDLEDNKLFDLNVFNPLAAEYLIESVKILKTKEEGVSGKSLLLEIREKVSTKDDYLSKKMINFIDTVIENFSKYQEGDKKAKMFLKNYKFL